MNRTAARTVVKNMAEKRGTAPTRAQRRPRPAEKGRDAAVSTRIWSTARAALTVVALAGLALDAYVHLDLASTYDGVKSSILSQGDLFRAETALAILAAVALLLRPRRYTALFALLVAAGGLAAVLVYQYVDVGAFGPVPDMYEPVWYPEKTQSAWGEGIAAVASLALVIVIHLQTRRAARTGTPNHPRLATVTASS